MDVHLNVGDDSTNAPVSGAGHTAAPASASAHVTSDAPAAPTAPNATISGPENVTVGDFSPETTGGDVSLGNDAQVGPTFGDQDFGSELNDNNLGSSFGEHNLGSSFGDQDFGSSPSDQNFGSSFEDQAFGSSHDGNNLGSSDLADINSSPEFGEFDLGSIGSLLGSVIGGATGMGGLGSIPNIIGGLAG